MLIDTHCHLDASEFSEDRDAVVFSARKAGVSGMVVPAVKTTSFTSVRDCCRRYPNCFPAYGIHPLYLNQSDETDLVVLREWLQSECDGRLPPVAIGEIGLDHYALGFDAVRQEIFFVEQLKIARDFNLPVLLHIRRAADQVLKCLHRVGVRGGIAHAFNGSRQQADEFIRLGFKLGFGGAMTYPGSTRIRELAATLPMDSIVFETDSPDLPPYWLQGKRNTPAELLPISRVFSELRGLSTAEVQAISTDNVIVLLKLPLSVLTKQDSF